MASKIKVDQIEGSTGSTITIPTGQTFTVTDGIPVASGGTGLASFTAGDILYATGATTLTKLNKGTAEQVLAMNAGATAPDWGSVDVSVGGTGLASFTAGDIMYATGATTLAKLAKGSAAEVLAMNAGATAPEWVEASGGKTIKRHTFSMNTRTAGVSGSSVQYTITSSFIPVNPVVNDLWVVWNAAINGQGQSWSTNGLEFNNGTTTYDYNDAAYHSTGSEEEIRGGKYHIPAGTIAAGTYTVKVKSYVTSGEPNYWNPNTSDNNRTLQQATRLMITEYKN
jgi:hypothetical protein